MFSKGYNKHRQWFFYVIVHVCGTSQRPLLLSLEPVRRRRRPRAVRLPGAQQPMGDQLSDGPERLPLGAKLSHVAAQPGRPSEREADAKHLRRVFEHEERHVGSRDYFQRVSNRYRLARSSNVKKT